MAIVTSVFEDVMATMAREQQTAKRRVQAECEVFRIAMAQAKIHSIHVAFDGSGDSGQIEDVSAYGQGVDEYLPDEGWAKLPLPITTNIPFLVHDENGKVIERIENRKTTEFKTAVENFTYSALEVTGVDWYNNDGGHGTLVMTLQDDGGRLELQLDVSTREVISNQAFYGDPSSHGDEPSR
jgi:hypothetical protein